MRIPSMVFKRQFQSTAQLHLGWCETVSSRDKYRINEEAARQLLLGTMRYQSVHATQHYKVLFNQPSMELFKAGLKAKKSHEQSEQ